MRFIFPHRHVNADTLSYYLDDQLSVSAQQRVARHLESCGHCREELESLRTTVSYLQDLPQFTTARSFTFAAPPPEPLAGRPGVTLWVPAWAYAGAASLAALALALLVLVDATGFSPPPSSPASVRSLAQSRPSPASEAAPAVEHSAPAAPHQAPAASTLLPAAAEAPTPVPATASDSLPQVARPEMAAAQEKDVQATTGVTPTPEMMAKAEVATVREPIPTMAPFPTPASFTSGQSTPAAEATPTPQTAATVASEPLAATPAPTPTVVPTEQPTGPTANPPTRVMAQAGGVAGGGVLAGSTPPPLTPTFLDSTNRPPATPVPAAKGSSLALTTPARPTPAHPATAAPAVNPTVAPRLAVAAQPTVAPEPAGRAGPAGASSQPVGPAGAAGPAGPAAQPGDSSSTALTDPRIDSRDESMTPRRRDSGSQWRVAQAMAAALVILFIGGLFFEVRRARRQRLS